MDKKNHKPTSEPVTKADPTTLKSEIIEAVQDTLKGLATKEDLKSLATQEALNALTTKVTTVTETVAETKEHVTELTGLMKEMLHELGATHEDVRYVRASMTMLAHSDAAHEAAIESLRKRLEYVERKVGIAK